MSTNTNSGSVAFDRPTGNQAAAHTNLETARERRIDLRTAMERLENQVARPSATGSWRADVEAALFELGAALDSHTNEVEDDSGLLQTIVAAAPRLAGQVAEMKVQHDELRSAFDRALATCSTHGELEPTVVRRRVTSLLGRLAVHRQLGSELVFNAYNVDIGDGD
ncbi:hypothetical protein BH23ACT4_BH23ACT4_05930 [soil metagenome]